jgi:hypothetical protein
MSAKIRPTKFHTEYITLAGGPHQRREYNAIFHLNADRIDRWVRHFSRFSRSGPPAANTGVLSKTME